jgi:hypothetical protein
MINEFTGTQRQIKAMEKLKIYLHTLEYGNRPFVKN